MANGITFNDLTRRTTFLDTDDIVGKRGTAAGAESIWSGSVLNAWAAGYFTPITHLTDFTNPHRVTSAQVGLGSVTNDAQVKRTEMGAVNGVATLDSAGKVPVGQLPATAITDTFVVNSQAAMLALAAQTGDVAVRTDVSLTYILQGTDPSVLANWVQLVNTGGLLLQANNLSDLANTATARANLGVAIGTNVQAHSTTLDAIAAGTWAGATSITTLGTIATGTWQGTAIANAYLANSAITIAGTSTALGGSITLDTLTGLSGTGMIARTAANVLAPRTITGTTNRVSVANGDGIIGNPTIDIAATYVGQSSITTLGTITTGVWNGTAIANANLANSTITIGSTSIALGGTSATLAGLNSITAASATDFVANGGSSGASLTLGQGASGIATLISAPLVEGTARSQLLVKDNSAMAAGVGGGISFSGIFTGTSQATGAYIRAAKTNATDGNYSFDLTFGARASGNSPFEGMRLTSTGNLLIGGTTDITGSGGLKVFGSTASTSTTSGAFQVSGGAGIGGTVNAPTFSNGSSYTLWTTSSFTELQSSATAGLRLKTTNATPVVIAVNGSTTAATFASDGSTTLGGTLTVSGTGTNTIAGPLVTSSSGTSTSGTTTFNSRAHSFQSTYWDGAASQTRSIFIQNTMSSTAPLYKFDVQNNAGTSIFSADLNGNAVVPGNLTVSGTGTSSFAGPVTISNATATLGLTSSTAGNQASISLADSVGRTLVLRSPSSVPNAQIGTSTNQDVEFIRGNTTVMSLVSGGLNISGVAGIGGATNAGIALYVSNTALTSTGQVGIDCEPVFTSAATSTGTAGYFGAATAAAAFTQTSTYGVRIGSTTKGAGSTITTNYGLRIENQTVGGTNYAISTGTGLVSFGDTTDATTGGAGSLTTAGGIYAAKQIIAAGKISGPATATSAASFNAPHGTAPTSPVDGDIWTTTLGLFVRINGVTKTVTLS